MRGCQLPNGKHGRNAELERQLRKNRLGRSISATRPRRHSERGGLPTRSRRVSPQTALLVAVLERSRLLEPEVCSHRLVIRHKAGRSNYTVEKLSSTLPR